MPSSSNFHLKESPIVHANFISRIFFWWLNDLFRLGYRKNLELSDLYKIQPEDESQKLGDAFYTEWIARIEQDQASGKQSQRKLLRVLLKIFGRRFAAIGLIKFFEECVSKIATPIILGYLIRFFTGEFDKTVGLLCCGGIVLGSILNILTMHPYFLKIEHIGMQIRLSCSTALYKKALKIKLSSLGGTVGQLMNLIANDVNRFDQIQHIHYIWIGLTQLTITGYILWTSFGPSCLCGIAILLLFTPFQGFLGGILSKLRAVSSKHTDKRIGLIHELLKGIRSIKMHCWEMIFSSVVEAVRKDEMRVIKKITALRSINWSLYYTSSKVAIFLTLVVYVVTGNVLTPEIVFVGVSLYNNIKITMTLHFPFGISQLVDFFVAVRRVEEFLLIDERKSSKSVNNGVIRRSDTKPGRISMRNVSAKWCADSTDENVLSSLNMEASSPQLLTIIGPVGSGKTCLLLTFLEELPLTQGSLEMDGQIAYAGQAPVWLFSGTIRENILLGRPFIPDWYDLVLDACALKRDCELFPDGDNTLIGNGTLSGGQQARTSLARAVYGNADIYLLDDVFSAVDVEVQHHIFQKCVQTLLRDKLVILVTHQLQFLPFADEVFMMEKGRFVAHGKSTVEAINPNCTNKEGEQTVNPNIINGNHVTTTTTRGQLEEGESGLVNLVDSNWNRIMMTKRKRDEQNDIPPVTNPRDNVSCGGIQGEIQSLEEEEKSCGGSVDPSVYRRYFFDGSNILMILTLLVFNILVQTLYTGSDYWLQIWSKYYENNANGNYTVESQRDFDYTEKITQNSYFYGFDFNLKTQILIYTSIIVFLFFFSLIRTTIFFEICLSSSLKLHHKMLAAVMRAPMKFFDLNPTGKILNRFTKDTKLMDEDLPQTFFESMEIFLNIIGIIILVCIVSPYILIPTILLSIAFYYVRKIYIRSARSVQRLEAITRSPVYAQISSTVNNGLPTIRAFQVEPDFHQKFCENQDTHSSMWFLTIAMTRWIGMWLDFISVTFIAAVVFTLTLMAEVSGAAAGMAISSSMFLTGVFQWGVRQSATVESQMVAIERILDYTTLTPEANLLSSPKNKPPNGWPFEGKIEFKNLNLQYNDDTSVLKHINIHIKPKEKIGIVGRTGAGKSSLITALFCLTEPSSGRIEIDGINILQIGLQDVRRAISIIPQDPFLFQGTLRRNLTNKNCSDSDLWMALRDVGIMKTIKECPLGLDVQIEEGGTNFSIGERQLICLAREILRKSNILILDEASGSIDEGTDILVQKTIREKFKDCTVITIAHRLLTIMDSDRILVLDEGMVKEFDAPHILLQMQGGLLSTMVEQTGEESHRLRRIAEQAYLRKNLETDLPKDNESCV